MIKRLTQKTTPRWIIFGIDFFIVLASIFIAYLLRFNFLIPESEIQLLYKALPFFLVIRLGSFVLGKTYAGIIRYTSTNDSIRIFTVLSAGTALLCIINIVNYLFNKSFPLPFSILIIDYMASMFFLITYRIIIKVLYWELKNKTTEKSNILIYGAGEAGIIAKRTLDRDARSNYKVVGFLDDSKDKIGKKLEGVYVYNGNELNTLLEEEDITNVIISPQQISNERKQQIVENCLNHQVKILNIPPAAKWINGELSFKQIKEVNIEDLLEREPIKLSEENISKQLKDKVILVTGAAGSIGSGLVLQIVKYKPKKLVLLDMAESALYEIEMELNDKISKESFEVVIGDIRSRDRMKRLFDYFKPEIVFHAAAYKHVPMMENNPSESIHTNVMGTKILADLSVEYKIEKFVMVSTDKAVNPTNVMGASKRIAEIYVQSLNKKGITKFITTRFGNVLGSNGSVIPRFKKQIEMGGPVTITHPEITRFFMTIPEACQLVLEAGTMGNGGEIFVFDMGKSVKIVDLAKKMIQLSGLELDKDIQIVYTGLRPGEKLYEELLNNAENTLPTHHPLILIGKVREYDFDEISRRINELIGLFGSQNNFKIVAKMKEIVPEFVSNNSIYSELDKENIHG